MTDTVALKKALEESGITIVFIAEKMGCSRSHIYSILSGSECTISEVQKLSSLLHLTKKQRDDIFFAKQCE